jgi:UDP-N-acetylglucosamine transferase subunit ALG13
LFRVVDKAIEEGVIKDNVFGQIGDGTYEPKNFEFKRFLDKEAFDGHISSAQLVLGHAGIGVITQALKSGVPLLVLARRAELGECLNNNQVTTARKFESLGHLISFEEGNLEEKLKLVKVFVPKQRTPNIEAVGKRIADFLTLNLTE